MYREDMSTLTPTARVILGMLALGARTGYDIKRVIDLSTRFFWGASYGQIYPELHRLEERGLVEATPEPTGGRRRTAYALTPAGESALQDVAARRQLVSLRDPRRGNAEALFR